MARLNVIDAGSEGGGGYEPPPAAPEPFHVPGMQSGNTGISGYGRPGGFEMPQIASPTTNFQGLNQGAILDYLKKLPVGTASLRQAFPELLSQGLIPQGSYLEDKATADEIYMPGYGWADFMSGADTGNPTDWHFNLGGGSYFSDPLLQGYLDFGQGAIDRLMQPQTINPVLQQAIEALTRMTNQGAPQMDMSFLQPLQAAVQKRQAQIDQPGWSPAQMDILRTQVTDPLAAQRDAARQQVMQRLAARGIQPGSGIMEQALLDVDKQFSEMNTTGQRDLASKQMAQDEARQQEAVQMNEVLSQLGLSGASANLQGQVAGRGQNLQAAGQLSGIGSQLQDEPIRNLMAAMGIQGNMAQLPFQANQNAIASMSAVNGQPVPQANDLGSLVQLLLGLSNQGEGVYNDAQQNGNSFWNILGGAMPDLLKTFAGMFGGGNGPAGPPPVGGDGGYG
jgi:hypothetical protein